MVGAILVAFPLHLFTSQQCIRAKCLKDMHEPSRGPPGSFYPCKHDIPGYVYLKMCTVIESTIDIIHIISSTSHQAHGKQLTFWSLEEINMLVLIKCS